MLHALIEYVLEGKFSGEYRFALPITFSARRVDVCFCATGNELGRVMYESTCIARTCNHVDEPTYVSRACVATHAYTPTRLTTVYTSRVQLCAGPIFKHGADALPNRKYTVLCCLEPGIYGYMPTTTDTNVRETTD